MSTETQQVVNEHFTVWSVSSSAWTGTDKLNAEDLGLEEVEDIFKLGKKNLIPDDERVNLRRASQQVNALLASQGKSFLNLRGAYIIPDSKLVAVDEGIEKIIEKNREILEDFLTRYEEIKADMIEAYPVLANAKWPSQDKIRRKFRIHKNVFRVEGVNVNEADPLDLIAAKRKSQIDLAESYDEMVAEILKEAHNAIILVCEDLTKRILETGNKVTETTLKKPRRIIEQYMNVAEVFDHTGILDEVSKLKRVVEEADAKEIREEWHVAQAFAESVKEIGSNVGDLSGINANGQRKRVLKRLDQAEVSEENA